MNIHMKDNIEQKKSSEDIFLWSDGTTCYRDESHLMYYRSDDYCVLYVDSDDYLNFTKEIE